MVHSIDRFEVAEKLNNACLQANMVMPKATGGKLDRRRKQVRLQCGT